MEKQENSIAATVGFVLILVVLITTVVIIISTRNTANLTPTPNPTLIPTLTPVPTIIPTMTTITPSVSPSPSVTVKPTNSPTPSVKVSPSISPTPSPTNIREISMNAFEYTFEPATLGQVKAGTQVQLTITNTGNADHDFVVDELGVNSGIIPPNESKVVTFTIPVNQASSYAYYCSISNHRSMGMQGTIEVVQ